MTLQVHKNNASSEASLEKRRCCGTNFGEFTLYACVLVSPGPRAVLWAVSESAHRVSVASLACRAVKMPLKDLWPIHCGL